MFGVIHLNFGFLETAVHESILRNIMVSETEGVKEKTRDLIALFNQYASDNHGLLSVVGVTATISALFLNLDPVLYKNGLHELQLPLLLFLLLASSFLTYSTYIWFSRNTEGWLSLSITSTFALTIFQLSSFIRLNFMEELRLYMSVMVICFAIALIVVLYRAQNYLLDKVSKTNYLAPLIFGCLAFITMYMTDLCLDLYWSFAKSETITIDIFTEPLQQYIYWVIAAWVLLFTFAFQNIKNVSKIMNYIILSPVLPIGLYFLIEIYYIFKLA